MGTYSVKLGNKSLEDKNNLNEIILMQLFFLKVKGDFPFLDVKKGVVRTLRLIPPLVTPLNTIIESVSANSYSMERLD